MKYVVYGMRFANGSLYVGGTSSFKRRRKHHRKTLHQGEHDNAAVQVAFNAAGEPEFVELAHAFDLAVLHEVEAAVIEALKPDLNRRTPERFQPPVKTQGQRAWGPYPTLRAAAAGEGVSYTQIKRISRVSYEDYLYAKFRVSISEMVKADEKAERKAANADAQKVLVDGVLDFPAAHRARIGMSRPRYRLLRSRGLDPFAPENRTPGMPTPPRLVTAHGRTQSVTEWALETGLSKQTITQRMDRLGWPPEHAVSATPYEPGHFMKQAAAQLAEQRATEGLEPTV